MAKSGLDRRKMPATIKTATPVSFSALSGVTFATSLPFETVQTPRHRVGDCTRNTLTLKLLEPKKPFKEGVNFDFFSVKNNFLDIKIHTFRAKIDSRDFGEICKMHLYYTYYMKNMYTKRSRGRISERARVVHMGRGDMAPRG